MTIIDFIRSHCDENFYKEYETSSMKEPVTDYLYSVEMGVIERLYQQMITYHTSEDELLRVIKYILILGESNKRVLNWQKAKVDFGIDELKKKYLARHVKPSKVVKTLTRNDMVRECLPTLEEYRRQIELERIFTRDNFDDGTRDDEDFTTTETALNNFYYRRSTNIYDDTIDEYPGTIRYVSLLLRQAIFERGLNELKKELEADDKLSIDIDVDKLLEWDGMWHNI